MARSNADLIQNIFEAIADSDIDALCEMLHPEIEWRPPPQGTLNEVYRGPDGVRQMFDQLFEAWERIGHEPTKLVEGDNNAVIISHINLRAKLSGLVIHELWAYYAEFRDGKLFRAAMYTDPEQALREHSSALLTNAPNWPTT